MGKWSNAITSCIFPVETRMNEGMLPRRLMRVWSLTAALRRRNLAQGNSARQRLMVVESKA